MKQISIEQLQEIFPDATVETWHQHVNGGGWIENTTTVENGAYIGVNARVYGDASGLRRCAGLRCLYSGNQTQSEFNEKRRITDRLRVGTAV